MKLLTEKEYLEDDTIRQSLLLKECHNLFMAYYMLVQNGPDMFIYEPGTRTTHGISISDLKQAVSDDNLLRMETETDMFIKEVNKLTVTKENVLKHAKFHAARNNLLIVRFDNPHELEAVRKLTENRFYIIGVIAY